MRHKRTIMVGILLGTLCMVPPVLLLSLSFFQSWSFPNVLPNSYGMESWQALFRGSNNIGKSLLTSFLVAILVAVLACAMGFFTSMVVSYHKRRKLLLFLTYLPFALAPVIFAVCIKFYFLKLNLTGSFAGVVLAQLIIAYPYATIAFTGFWNKQIQAYQLQAITLGATPGYTITHLLLPMAKPMLMVVLFQCFLISWFEYGLTLIIGVGKVDTLPLKVFQYLSEANMFQAALAASLLILPPILLLWVNKKFVYLKTV